MAASEPTSWLSLLSHILTTLSPTFGALAGDLGCFPLDREASPTRSCSRGSSDGIRSLVEIGRATTPLIHPELYLRHFLPSRPHLNAFRGEPAITVLD